MWPGKILVGHGDLRYYGPILIEKYKGLRTEAFDDVFAKVKKLEAVFDFTSLLERNGRNQKQF